jgi:hypothetical protein
LEFRVFVSWGNHVLIVRVRKRFLAAYCLRVWGSGILLLIHYILYFIENLCIKYLGANACTHNYVVSHMIASLSHFFNFSSSQSFLFLSCAESYCRWCALSYLDPVAMVVLFALLGQFFKINRFCINARQKISFLDCRTTISLSYPIFRYFETDGTCSVISYLD